MSLSFTDIFCGAGGSSIGLVEAGMELKLAANHWDRAIETHSANFPDAEHLCADVNNYDMRRLPKTNILWASPICTEISPAGGRKRKPVHGQLGMDLQEYGVVPDAAWERTRATYHRGDRTRGRGGEPAAASAPMGTACPRPPVPRGRERSGRRPVGPSRAGLGPARRRPGYLTDHRPPPSRGSDAAAGATPEGGRRGSPHR